MSVRRLADEAVQPAKFAFTKENAAWAKKRIALYPKGRQQSAVIPLLMRAQDQEGWVSRMAIEEIAGMLGMAYIRVLEVATFYTQFQLQPVGTRAHVQVCGTTPCMLRGAGDLISVCKSKIHAEGHHLNEAGTLSWEEVECQGACVNAPMVAIGHDTYEDLTAERLEEIIDAFAEGKGDTIKPGPQIERTFSAPESGFTTLTDVPKPEKRKAGTAAKKQSATTPGRKKEVPVEAAPAVDGPDNKAKVSQGKAESARKTTARTAKANGEPNKAARPKAVGAESKAGKIDGGRAAGKPEAGAPLFDAPQGAADDLKLISGVGPVLEKKLNALGITQYAQVAAFKKADIVRVDDALSFKGRIERDEWVKQAKALAKGGVEEYIRVFGKKPV